MGRNTTGPPMRPACQLSTSLPGHRPARLLTAFQRCILILPIASRQRYRRRQTMTTDDDDRCQPAKQYRPIRQASNKIKMTANLSQIDKNYD